MSRPNYTCSYQHYYMDSAKASNRGNIYYFKNPSQGSPNLAQYSVNEIEFDYSFYNVRSPYNRVVYYQTKGLDGKPLVREVVIPEGNYSITELYSKFQAMLNTISEDSGWVVSTFELEANSNKCKIVWTKNQNVVGQVETYPNIVLGYGLDGGVRGLAKAIGNFDIPNLPENEVNAFYSIMLWMLGRQVPSLPNKDLLGHVDTVASYDPLSNQTFLTYTSPTIPQASFDRSVYLVSEYFNNFDQTIYEDVTDPTGETDLDITGANISDIWLKIPTSFYNFGERVWYWPRTPYTFNMSNSNQDVDIRIVDLFNRPINVNSGNFNMHLVFYFSRDTNFI